MSATAPAIEARVTVQVGRGADAFRVTAELTLDDGVMVFYGPSGAGKSTILKALAGLVRPLSGRIAVHGRVLFDSEAHVRVPPHHRGIGYVPQHNSLFPFHDVASNVAFGLPRHARRRGNPAVRAILEELGIAHLASASPGSLSGGERQKVALARALVVSPRLVLLDEPFASVDRAERLRLRGLLRNALARHATPAVFVTHSPEEALQMGDSMVCFEAGRTVARGRPSELLGIDAPVVLEGLVVAREVGPDGRVTMRLDGAKVSGPDALLTVDGEGRVSLKLQRSVGVDRE